MPKNKRNQIKLGCIADESFGFMGETFRLIAGPRQMNIPSSFAVKMRRQ